MRGSGTASRQGPGNVRHVDAEAVRAWFFGGSLTAALAWAALVLLLAAALFWFFAISPYGEPATPVYAEF